MALESISLKFKTLWNSGILLHAEGHSEHSLTLELEKGKLLLLLRKGTTDPHTRHVMSAQSQTKAALNYKTGTWSWFLIGQIWFQPMSSLLYFKEAFVYDANILVTVVLAAMTPSNRLNLFCHQAKYLLQAITCMSWILLLWLICGCVLSKINNLWDCWTSLHVLLLSPQNCWWMI